MTRPNLTDGTWTRYFRPARLRRIRHRRQRFGPTVQRLEDRALMAAPTGAEQELLEWINRFRMDPAGEFSRFISSISPPGSPIDGVSNALNYFHVDLNLLQRELSALTPVAALAWNSDLNHVAELHDQAMIRTATQDHQVPGEPDLRTRFNNGGYTGWSYISENIYAYAQSVPHAHAGFVIDWGGTVATGGMQSPRGHRDNIMSSSVNEVGIRILSHIPANDRDTGPLVVTEDFGKRFAVTQPYLLGVVYTDANRDNFYQDGEGIGGVTIVAQGPSDSYTTTTFAAGGYQMNLPAGTYTVTFSGAGLATKVVSNVAVGSQNRKLDLIPSRESAPGPVLTSIANVTPSPRNLPVTTVDVTFSGAIDSSTLTYQDLTLTRDGKAVTLGAAISTSLVSGTTYRISGLGAYTGAGGNYVLTINGSGVSNSSGNAASGTLQTNWVMDTIAPAASFIPVTPNTRPGAVSTIDVVFSESMDPTSLSYLGLTLTRDNSVVPLGSAVTISPITGSTTTYRISGLTTYTGLPGGYALYLNMATASDLAGNPGTGTAWTSWTVSSPVTATITPVSPFTRDTAVASVDVTFSREIATSSFTASALSLTRGGNVVTPPGLSIAKVSGTTYRINGLTMATTVPGTYVLMLDTTKVTDLDGTAGSGMPSTSWIMTPPPAVGPRALTVTPSTRSSTSAPMESVILSLAISQPVDPSTLAGALSLKRTIGGSTMNVSLDNLVVTQVSSTEYRISGSGLSMATATPGDYILQVDGTKITDTAGVAGTGTPSTSWTTTPVATGGPKIKAVVAAARNSASEPVRSVTLNLTVSNRINLTSLFGALSLTRTVGAITTELRLSGVSASIITSTDTLVTYRVNGLAAVATLPGTYTLRIDGTKILDSAGTAGTGSATTSWIIRSAV